MIVDLSKSIVVALNGRVPQTNAKRMMPRLQISDLKPLYPLSSMISGDIYAGVPHCSLMISRWSVMMRLMPKSQSLILPDASIRILSSLTSRCNTDLQWQWPTLLTTYRKITLASSSSTDLHFFMNESRSPPDAYSITIKMSALVSTVSNSLITFRCRMTLRRWISVLIFLY